MISSVTHSCICGEIQWVAYSCAVFAWDCVSRMGPTERAGLVEQWIATMGRSDLLEACAACGQVLPEHCTEDIARMSLRMYYAAIEGGPPDSGLDAEPDEQKPAIRLNNFRIGDKLAAALSEGLVKLGAQGVDPAAIHLANNSLTDHGVMAISRAIAKLNNLTLLDISENRIGRAGADALAKTMLTHEALQELRLSRCHLGDAAAPLLNSLVQNNHLKTLDLARNQLGSPVVCKALAKLLKYNSTITTVRLGWNHLRSHKFDWVTRAIGENSSLVT